MGGRLVKGMFHRAIISGMAASPQDWAIDLAAGALALQVFVKNAQYVEIIVNVAFAAIPSILGIGAAGLLGHGIINTARDVMSSISLLKTAGPMAQLGGMVGRRLNTLRKETAERWLQSDNRLVKGFGIGLAPIQFVKSKRKNQDTQGKQDEKGGGSGGNPPPPPDIKSDKKKEQAKIDGIPIDEYAKKKRKEMGLE